MKTRSPSTAAPSKTALGRIRLASVMLATVTLGSCTETGLSPWCLMASDVMTKARSCPLSPDEKRAFDAEISRRQKAAAAYSEAQWEASNPGKCPRRLTQPYDHDLASQDSNFMQMAQFTLVSDGYGRGVTRVYVPSTFGDQMLARMQETMKKRDDMCRKAGFEPAGFVPPIFGHGI